MEQWLQFSRAHIHIVLPSSTRAPDKHIPQENKRIYIIVTSFEGAALLQLSQISLKKTSREKSKEKEKGRVDVVVVVWTKFVVERKYRQQRQPKCHRPGDTRRLFKELVVNYVDDRPPEASRLVRSDESFYLFRLPSSFFLLHPPHMIIPHTTHFTEFGPSAWLCVQIAGQHYTWPLKVLYSLWLLEHTEAPCPTSGESFLAHHACGRIMYVSCSQLDACDWDTHKSVCVWSCVLEALNPNNVFLMYYKLEENSADLFCTVPLWPNFGLSLCLSGMFGYVWWFN